MGVKLLRGIGETRLLLKIVGVSEVKAQALTHISLK
jgi:hypothetical protein